MSPETCDKLERVRKYSASLRTLFNILSATVAIAALVTLVILFSDAGEANRTLVLGNRSFSGDDITPTVRLVVGIGVLLTCGIVIKLLYHLAALFDLYARGRIFTAANVVQIRQIGISVFLFLAVWAYTLICGLVPGGSRVAATTSAGDVATTGFSGGGGDPLLVALGGVVIIVVSWIMDVGRELREEQDLTV